MSDEHQGEQPDEQTEQTEQDGAEQAPVTADAVVVQRVGSVNQAEADKDAERRNAELVEQGTLSDRGYIGSDASDLQG